MSNVKAQMPKEIQNPNAKRKISTTKTPCDPSTGSGQAMLPSILRWTQDKLRSECATGQAKHGKHEKFNASLSYLWQIDMPNLPRNIQLHKNLFLLENISLISCFLTFALSWLIGFWTLSLDIHWTFGFCHLALVHIYFAKLHSFGPTFHHPSPFSRCWSSAIFG